MNPKKPRIMRPHWRKVAFITGEVYCGVCGRDAGWPCRNDRRNPPGQFHMEKLDQALKPSV